MVYLLRDRYGGPFSLPDNFAVPILNSGIKHLKLDTVIE